MSNYYSCIRCVTTWGAVLTVVSISDYLIGVTDHNAIDAGMYIGVDDVETMWKIRLYADCSHPQYTNKEWAKIEQYF